MDIFSLIFVTRIRYVSSTTATRLQGRRSGRRNKFFAFPECPVHFWGPPCLLFSRY